MSSLITEGAPVIYDMITIAFSRRGDMVYDHGSIDVARKNIFLSFELVF